MGLMLLKAGFRCLVVSACVWFSIPAFADPAERPTTMNKIIKEVVDDLRVNRAGGGYDMSKAFTQDLKYGSDCCVKASHPHLTMCVAASSEIIIETLNRYFHQTGDGKPFSDLPMRSWTSGSRQSIRSYVFMYEGTGSRGTGFALARFGIGGEKPFKELAPYDFINMNRTGGSGHSAVFIAYLKPDQTETSEYSSDVIGFHYFSAQGKGKPDAGFADRYAFFDTHCPSAGTKIPRDCKIIKSANLALIDGGELWSPKYWRTAEAKEALVKDVRRGIEDAFPGTDRGFIDSRLDAELSQELSPNLSTFTGETTD
ncbi:hypothetical protein [Beijerinckia sp. L45]|uniref:hypothetical protein n=1 Tax=Beijerinckia sp. L45 TaxID=1641855 RepID=UPI00131B72D5|nr:hypothetical protein [Beijerinckia sp. L45]